MKWLKTALAATGFALGLQACAQEKGTSSPETEGGNMGIVHLTKAEFLDKVFNYEANPDEWKYEGEAPCIVDFYATWCGPCKALAPMLEELAGEYGGKIHIYKVDVDKEEELAAVFGIRSIPTLLWIPKEGQPALTQGIMPKTELKRMVDSTLLGGE